MVMARSQQKIGVAGLRIESAVSLWHQDTSAALQFWPSHFSDRNWISCRGFGALPSGDFCRNDALRILITMEHYRYGEDTDVGGGPHRGTISIRRQNAKIIRNTWSTRFSAICLPLMLKIRKFAPAILTLRSWISSFKLHKISYH